jgi:hypothetical protein
MSVMKRACALGAALAASLLASPAFAAPSEGELLFREGRAAMAEKDFDRACQKFADSQKKEPAPGTALNLGECEEQRGHLLAATEAFNLAASTYATPDKQKYATGRAEAAERRIPRLKVRTTKPVPGLVVHVGTKDVPTDTDVKLDPGEVVIKAEAPGRKPTTQTVALHEGKSVEVEITLEPLSGDDASGSGDGASATMSPRNSDRMDLRTTGLIVGGVGAASIAVGAVTGFLALGKASDVKDHCGADLVQCDQEGLDAASSGGTLATVSTITFIAGGALAVGGGLLYFLSPHDAKTTGAVHVIPAASQSAASLVLRGSF